LLLAVVAVVAVAVRIRRNAQPLRDSRPPDAAMDDIVAYMARRGFVVSHSGAASATFTRNKWPDWQMLVFLVGLWFLGVAGLEQSPLLILAWTVLMFVVLVCYLLYFPIVRPTATTGVTALGDASGTEIVLSGNDRKARADLKRWLRQNQAA
jgi:hypothetical protein